MTGEDLVITGLGCITSQCSGRQGAWQRVLATSDCRKYSDYSLASLNPAPLVRDRRHLKSISHADAIGMVGFSQLLDDTRWSAGQYPAEKIGLYIGSPAPYVGDNDAYNDAIKGAAKADGHFDMCQFARLSQAARPVTLLVGLVNNVLCYGSLLLDARGPNSNYTVSGVSGHVAILSAMRRLRRGQLDMAVAGGFTTPTDIIHTSMLKKHGLVSSDVDSRGDLSIEPYPQDADHGTVPADGAAFITIERRAQAKERGASVYGVLCGAALTSDGLGPKQFHHDGRGIVRVIRQALRDAKIEVSDVGLILSGAIGLKDLDQAEMQALTTVFADVELRPALAVPAKMWGNLFEAGGVMELALMNELYDHGAVPSSMMPNSKHNAFASQLRPEKPYALVLRITPWGDYGCVIVKREGA